MYAGIPGAPPFVCLLHTGYLLIAPPRSGLLYRGLTALFIKLLFSKNSNYSPVRTKIAARLTTFGSRLYIKSTLNVLGSWDYKTSRNAYKGFRRMLLRILSYNAYLGIVQSIGFGVGTPWLGEGCSDVTDVRIGAHERHHLGARTIESTDSRPLSFLLSRLLTHSLHTDH